jgi:arginine deiminase
MENNKLEEDTEKGVEALDLQWPHYDSIYEIRIPRIIVYENAKEKSIGSLDDYFEFLKENVFPMIEELEREAQISYWHILNHGKYLDLRIAIKLEQVRKAHSELKNTFNRNQSKNQFKPNADDAKNRVGD